MAAVTLEYPYAAKSIQDDRALYMYSPMGDRAFIANYLESRIEAMKRMRDIVGEGAMRDHPPHLPAAIPLPGDTAVVTKTLSEACLRQADRNAAKPNIAAWSDFFVRKFETSRKLATEYSATLRGSAQEADLATYCIVARFVSRVADTTTPRGLRLLNGLLKLNDFACYRAGFEPVTPEIAYHAAASMQAETQLVRRMLA